MASCAATRTIFVTSSCCRVRNSRGISSSSATSTSAPRSVATASSAAAVDAVWLRGPSGAAAGGGSPAVARCGARSRVSVGVGRPQARRPASATSVPALRTHTSLVRALLPAVAVAVPPLAAPDCASHSEGARRDLLLLASAAALSFVAAAATTASAGDAGAAAASAATSTFGRGAGGGGGAAGGGGGGSAGPSTKTAYSSTAVVTKAEAEEDVRKWEEDASRYPYMVSDSAVQGARWTMEDAYTIANGGHFAAVYDGHGGDAVSGMLRDRLHNLYTKALPQRHYDEKQRLHDVSLSVPSIRTHTTALRGALKRVEREVLRQDDLEFQGSTAVVVIVHVDEEGQRSLLSANVGDSRAVLSRGGKAVDLTRDHKPSDEREKARIRSMGEDVEWDPYGELYRVKDLSLSRAIGDRFAKPVVTSEAEIDCITVVDDEDEFFVLASDGLWDVMTSQEVVNFVRDNMRGDPAANPNMGPEEKRRKMARMVANEALERGSADNVCVILVWLQERQK